MQAKHSLEFSRAPSVWSMYPKIMTSRKPSLLPEGGEVPRIESRLSAVVIDRKHLASYSDICGAAPGDPEGFEGPADSEESRIQEVTYPSLGYRRRFIVLTA